jgi:hypothetical protein
MNILIMFNSTKILLNIETIRLKIYLVEGSMLKAPVALCTLVNIVRCSMSRTIVDVRRCTQCSPSNVDKEEDGIIDRIGNEQSHQTLPKTWPLGTLEQVTQTRMWFQRPLFQSTVHAEDRNGEAQEEHNSEKRMQCILSRPCGRRQALLLINAEGGRWSVEDEPQRHDVQWSVHQSLVTTAISMEVTSNYNHNHNHGSY